MDTADKLLGFKTHNYVSSSESEPEDDENSNKGSDDGAQNVEEEEITLDFRAQGPRTGPKGVLEDYRRYRQLAAEQREEKKAELESLAKKFSITCKSSLDEEKEKKLVEELDLEEDEFIKMYHIKRLQEMKTQAEQYVSSIRPTFGRLFDISGKDYLDVIDNENPCVVVIMHLFRPGLEGCESMTGCLKVLSQQYPRVKFCQVLASETGISKYFVDYGLPALLVYQNKQLIGNHVKMGSVLGDDFYSTDVESFLIENGILSENTPDLAPGSLRSNKEDSEDSDG